MKRNLPRKLGLWGGTLLAVGLAGWALLGPPVKRSRGQAPTSTQGVGPLRRLWNAGEAHLHGSADAGGHLTLARALERLGVTAWHKAGQQGRGIKVAILDSGFRGYRYALGKALPARVQTRSFRRDGNLEAKESQHGILCAEVVCALAPEAELLLANWEPEQPEQFLQAVQWARQQGARIISCSIIMPTWSDGEGGGTVHARLSRALGEGDRAGDVLCFASAGNTALRHWAGTFRAGRGGWHRWGRSGPDNAVLPLCGERVSVELYGPPGAAYELVLRDTTAKRDLGRTRSPGADGGPAVVRFDPHDGHQYAVRVRLRAGKAGRFHLTALGGRLEHAARQGSIPFPGDGPEVLAVGAVDGRGRRCYYSSCGPIGGRTKPDLAAPVPFPSKWRSSQPFGGTSAAAPQAAGLAALVWGRHPDWTAQQVRAALCQAARPPTMAAHNCETGYGELHLP
jgi:subtilisin family serine protease